MSVISSPLLMALTALTLHTQSVSIEFWVFGLQLEFIMAVRGKRPRILSPTPRISKAFTSRTSFALERSDEGVMKVVGTW